MAVLKSLTLKFNYELFARFNKLCSELNVPLMKNSFWQEFTILFISKQAIKYRMWDLIIKDCRIAPLILGGFQLALLKQHHFNLQYSR